MYTAEEEKKITYRPCWMEVTCCRLCAAQEAEDVLLLLMIELEILWMDIYNKKVC